MTNDSNSEDFINPIDPDKITDRPHSLEYPHHLGNVLTVITDRKLAVEDPLNPGTVGYYTADVVLAQDFYPFGQKMAGRVFSATEYDYGFNGKREDSEIFGEGNSYDYGARMYNPRIGIWFSTDPMASRYASESPYVFSGNSPILYNDEGGKFKVPKNIQKKYPLYTIINANLGKLVSSDKVLQESLMHYGHYKDLSAMLEVYGNDTGPLAVADPDGVAEGSTTFTRYTEFGYPSEEAPLDNVTTNDLIVNVSRANVKSMEKKFKKLQDPDLSDDKRAKLMSSLEKDVHHVVTTLLHEGVHVGDGLKNGYFSNKDVEGTDYTNYNSNDPYKELGAAALESAGYTKNAYTDGASPDLIQRVVDVIMEGIEIPTKTEENK